MHKNGWRPFWAALGAALLVLLPLVGGTVLLTRQMVRTRIQTAQPQSGVPIQLPRAEHRMTLLLCTAGEQPGFLLVYLNAAQNSLNLLAMPGELTVPFNGETASLAHCYGAAGPARCRQALLEVLGLPEDMLYLALSPAVLEKTASRYGPVRVGFSGALTADELAETGLSAAVQSISESGKASITMLAYGKGFPCSSNSFPDTFWAESFVAAKQKKTASSDSSFNNFIKYIFSSFYSCD